MTKKIIIIVTIVFLLMIIGLLSYFLFFKKEVKKEETQGTTTGKTVTIPEKVLSNKFGFLSAGEDDYQFINDVGAAWVRPHPGAFLWDDMQKSLTASYSFENTDKEVKKYQERNLAILATLWPFANWDQENHSDYIQCQVSDQDEFLPRNNKKGRDSYLPEYRCNPDDWEAYNAWIKAAVERYDGDGINDMPGLIIPIKFWEVMNEPDLTSPKEEQGNERLDFYKEDAIAYAELLIKTSQAIRQTDPEAKIVIAGAAGGNEQFLNFYRQVFQNPGAITAFDLGNIHCISNDSYDSFNVEPYKKLLAEFNLDIPIWVTEAEAIVSSNADINATQTFNSTKKALEFGAVKIFYTRYEFTERFGQMMPPEDKQVEKIQPTFNGGDAVKAYQAIIRQ